jgi:hypothetical protein
MLTQKIKSSKKRVLTIKVLKWVQKPKRGEKIEKNKTLLVDGNALFKTGFFRC